MYYEQVGGEISQLQQSKEPQQKQLSQWLATIEFENLTQAVQLALAAQSSVLNPYRALSNYFDATQNHRQGLEFGQKYWRNWRTIPPRNSQGS